MVVLDQQESQIQLNDSTKIIDQLSEKLKSAGKYRSLLICGSDMGTVVQRVLMRCASGLNGSIPSELNRFVG